MKSRTAFSFVLFTAPVAAVGLAGLVMVACSDSETFAFAPTEDGGDVAHADANAPDATPQDAGIHDASPIDAALTPVTCSVTPCVKEIATAGSSVCALLSDGTVRCWGADDYGQLGRGEIDGGQDPVPAPVQGLSGVTQIAAGNDAYCVTLEGGDVRCWGNNGSGRLGNTDVGESSTPIAVAGLAPVRGVFIGDGIACAALVAGDVSCWGASDLGRIPFDDPDAASSGAPRPPTKIDLGGRAIRQVAAGKYAVVALADDGTLVSWGQRSLPKAWKVSTLGRESTLDPAAPAELPAPGAVTRLAGWGGVAAAAGSEGSYRWGLLKGYIGPVLPDPVAFATNAVATDVSISESGQFCAVLTDKSARCLGKNDYGQLGTGDFNATQVVPAVVNGLPKTPVRIVTNVTSACAVLESGEVACWGNNVRGQLGTGDYVMHSTPQLVRFSP